MKPQQPLLALRKVADFCELLAVGEQLIWCLGASRKTCIADLFKDRVERQASVAPPD